jgi:glycosyltransferase involved in cell wall biosynthesis
VVNPLVSIMIPVRDGARYLAEALRSALDQPGAEIEVVVVDDGSTDASASIAESFGESVRVLRQEQLGLGPTRNSAVAASSGAFFAFLDADDRFTPAKTASQLAALADDPDLEAVFGHARQFMSPDVPNQTKDIWIPREVAPVEIPGTMLIRREAFERVGPFASFQIASSIDWILRAHEVGLRTAMLDEVVYERRIHGRNMGIERRSSATEQLQVLKASLDRRRAAGDQDTGDQDTGGRGGRS